MPISRSGQRLAGMAGRQAMERPRAQACGAARRVRPCDARRDTAKRLRLRQPLARPGVAASGRGCSGSPRYRSSCARRARLRLCSATPRSGSSFSICADLR